MPTEPLWIDLADATATPPSNIDQVVDELQRLHTLLTSVAKRSKRLPKRKDYYSPAEFALLIDRAEVTVRHLCRIGRIKAVKSEAGTGATKFWLIPHSELKRFQKAGSVPAKE